MAKLLLSGAESYVIDRLEKIFEQLELNDDDEMVKNIKDANKKLAQVSVKKIKTKKEEGAPKRNQNAYMYFLHDARNFVKDEDNKIPKEVAKKLKAYDEEKYRKKHGDKSKNGKKLTSGNLFSAFIGEIWGAMKDSEKKIYLDEATNDKERYEKEKEEYSKSKNDNNEDEDEEKPKKKQTKKKKEESEDEEKPKKKQTKKKKEESEDEASEKEESEKEEESEEEKPKKKKK
jgi:hypothetical protein